MAIELHHTAQSHVAGGDHRSLVAWSDDWSGTINGKAFRVQISPTEPAHWYDSDLDDDEKAEVLAELDGNDAEE